MAFRILSLDGGGSWALIQAMALDRLYPGKSGRQILADFDLVAANSGGSITLAGLIKDLTPLQIVDLFEDKAKRESIFVKRPWYERIGTLFQGAKYSTAGKLKGLTELFGASGQTPMSALDPQLPAARSGPGKVRILITGFDYDRQRAEFFRSYPTPMGAAASTVRLVDAVHASSDAPILFFDKPTDCGGRRYWDGAVAGYNNPLLAAIVEAVVLGSSPHDIQARSIGTGTVRLAPHDTTYPAAPELKEDRPAPSVLGDLRKMAGAITDDPPDAASYIAWTWLKPPPLAPKGPSGPLVRLNPVFQPVLKAGAWDGLGLPPATFKRVSDIGMDAVDPEEVAWVQWIARSWIAGPVPNQPVLTDNPTLACKLGDASFAAGAARW